MPWKERLSRLMRCRTSMSTMYGSSLQGVRTSWWRGVGPTHNIFVVESFIDELAHAAKQDPVAYRQGLLVSHNPRARLLSCRMRLKKRPGESPFPHGMAVGFQYNSHMEATRRRSPRSRWNPMAR